jgi:hypothetical protein
LTEDELANEPTAETRVLIVARLTGVVVTTAAAPARVQPPNTSDPRARATNTARARDIQILQ